MTKPLVSIIIPCYNAEKYVAESIQSALDQTYPNCEVIVIDDGSTDGSLDIIKSFGDRIRWETGPNRGGCAARNRGLHLSKGVYVKFIDADDALVADSIEMQVEQSGSLDNTTIAVGTRVPYDKRGTIDTEVSGANTPPMVPDTLMYLLDNIVITPMPLHRRNLLEQCGGFTEHLHKGQEYDLHIRLALLGVQMAFYNTPVYLHREHGSPDRISIRNSVELNPEPSIVLHDQLAGVLLTQANIENARLDLIKRRVATKWWVLGREIARTKRYEMARECFRKSRLVHTHIKLPGSIIYRMTASMFGPLVAERTMELFKALLPKR